MWNNIYLIVLLFSAISSLKAFRLDMAAPFRLFSGFLFFVLFIETCAVAWPRLVKYYGLPYSNENHWVYNIYLIPAYLFYSYFYYRQLKSPAVKKIILSAGLLFFFTGVFNLLFFQGLYKFNTYTVLAAGMLVTFASVSYFYQILRDKSINPLNRDPLFWISSGAFLFHLTTMLGLFFILFLNNWYGKAAHATIMVIKITSIVMYFVYSIAFLCQKKTS